MSDPHSFSGSTSPPLSDIPDGKMVSIAKLKAVAQRLLPSSSSLRGLILSEKDLLPTSEALIKFEIYDRLLSRELGSSFSSSS